MIFNFIYLGVAFGPHQQKSSPLAGAAFSGISSTWQACGGFWPVTRSFADPFARLFVLPHDILHELIAGRNVVDEASHHARAPGPRIELPVMEHLFRLVAGDEMADILDGDGSALRALDFEHLLDRLVLQHTFGIAQGPHDEGRLPLIGLDQGLLDLDVDGRLDGGDAVARGDAP